RLLRSPIKVISLCYTTVKGSGHRGPTGRMVQAQPGHRGRLSPARRVLSPGITRHIAFSAVGRYDGAMADARSNRSLSPDIQPAQDVARLERRASDADRDRTAAVLGNAMATGRLTTTEHAERLDAAYTAKTLGELVQLTRDLPADDATLTGVGTVD